MRGAQIYSVCLFVGCLSTVLAYDLPTIGNGFLQNVRRPDLCLSIASGSLAMAPCDLASKPQAMGVFWLTYYNPGSIIFRAANAWKIVEVLGGGMADGDRMALAEYNEIHDSITLQQKWAIDGGTVGTTFQLKNSKSGKCLTAEGLSPIQGSGAGNSYLDQWTCVGAANAPHQTWRLVYYPNVPIYPIMLKSASQTTNCLDHLGGNTQNGAAAGLYTCVDAATNQHWFLDVVPGTNNFMLRNRLTNMCLQVNGEYASNGGTVTMWTCPSAPAPNHFLWTLRSPDPDAVGMRYAFENVNNPGQCLNEAVGYSNMWDCNSANTTNQYFIWRHPAQYLKTAGTFCLGTRECLSDTCTLFLCAKRAHQGPCQSNNDCVSGNCGSGTCV